MSKATDKIRDAMREKEPEQEPKREGLLSSGATMLNLACTDRPFGALQRGGYYLIIGDSSAGKTLLTLTMLAEAAMNPSFDDYDLYFDNIENGAFFLEKFFGERIAARIKAPRYDDSGAPIYSDTVESFYFNLDQCFKRGRPFIYLADSENNLTSDAEKKKSAKRNKAIETSTVEAGSMTDGKPKVHSQNLRVINGQLLETDSILILLSQTRQRIGFGAEYDPKTRSGGDALKFYAQVEMWLSIRKILTKTVNDSKREIGVLTEIRVKKNRFTGKRRTIFVPIYHSVGIDDLGSCIQYLVDENWWKESEGVITAPEFDFKGKAEKLIRIIEDEDRENELQLLAAKCWAEIEEKCRVVRKSRYESEA